MVVNDVNVPLDGNGISVFEDVWRYMLGLPCQGVQLDELSNAQMSVAPNPFDSELTISFEQSALRTLELSTLSGTKVYSTKREGSNYVLDLSHLPKGVYLLSVKDASGMQINRKVMK